MHYTGTVYRAPFDAMNPLLEITQGCTHNNCKFCNMYKGIPFRMSPLEWVEEDLKEIQSVLPHTNRLTFIGGNPFALSFDKLMVILNLVHKYLPDVNYITSGARITDVQNKTVDQLKELQANGIARLYLGIESGDDWTLKRINKGYTSDIIIPQCLKLEEAGIPYWLTFLNGIADKEHSYDHALHTAQIFSQLKPEEVGTSSLVLFPDTALAQEAEAGLFHPLNEKELMEEMKVFLENLHIENNTQFNMHHTSALPMNGVIPRDQKEFIQRLDQAIQNYDKIGDALEYHRSHTYSL